MPSRSTPSFAVALLIGLFVLQVVGLFLGLPRFHPPGKTLLPLLIVCVLGSMVYALLLWGSFRSIRAGTTAASVATGRGIVCLLLGFGWAAASLAVIWNDSTSMTLGVFALGGIFLWYPLVLAGAVFLLAVRR